MTILDYTFNLIVSSNRKIDNSLLNFDGYLMIVHDPKYLLKIDIINSWIIHKRKLKPIKLQLRV